MIADLAERCWDAIVVGAGPSMGNRAIRGGQVDSSYYRRPTTRMGVVWEVRRAFYDAKESMQQTQGAPPPAAHAMTHDAQGDALDAPR